MRASSAEVSKYPVGKLKEEYDSQDVLSMRTGHFGQYLKTLNLRNGGIRTCYTNDRPNHTIIQTTFRWCQWHLTTVYKVPCGLICNIYDE